MGPIKSVPTVLMSLLLLIVTVGGRERMCASEDAISIWTGMPGCQPRETIVEVPQTIMDPSLFQIVPKFVSVQRCSGTCQQGNQYHNCIATKTTQRIQKIMIQRLNSTGHLYSTCSEVSIEEHGSCACGCRISQGDCKTNQYFSANLCRCECNDRNAMQRCFVADEGRGVKIWDASNCRCRCAESYRECSTGYVYDQTDSCSCVPELRPASTVPVVALVVALIGTITCLILVFINYRRTRRVLMNIQREHKLQRQLTEQESRKGDKEEDMDKEDKEVEEEEPKEDTELNKKKKMLCLA